MDQKFELFLVKQVGPVLDVRINRPEARNAITFAMEGELADLLNIAADDDSVRVVTLQGEGKIFSAGHDLKEVASRFANDGHPAGADRHEAPQLRDLWYRRSRPRRPRRESTGSTS
jgi:enoyl-CoA hydratase/carnithine racemase